MTSSVDREQNRALVLRFCQYLSDRKLAEMFALMDEESTWSGVGDPKLFKYGGPRTKARSVEFIGAFLTAFTTFRFDVVSSTAEDDRVAIEASSVGTGPGAKRYRNQYILMFQCRDGRISRISEFFDQLTVLDYEAQPA